MERKTITIDASGKSMGRLAADIAVILRGKDKPTFVPNKDEGDFVAVKNADKMKFTGKKLEQKIYFRHTGYMGGLKEVIMGEVFAKEPGEVLRRAVWGMLPKNKLRPKQIKRLKFSKSE